MKSQLAEAPTFLKLLPKQLSTLTPTASVTLTGFFTVAITAPYVTGYMLIATINLFILLIGFTLRHQNRKAHATLMSLGVLSDLALVLTLQFQRNAIQTAMAFKLTALNQAHIGASTAATALYIPAVVMGISLYRQKNHTPNSKLQTLHRRVGWTALILRTLGFFLMFSMLGNHAAP